MPIYAPSFNTTSARAQKTAIDPVSPPDVLERVEALDVNTWEFTETDDGRHIGPMAEDFAEQFALGDDEHIATVDADGVAFAAIQGLAAENAEQADTIDELQTQNEDLRQRCDEQAGTIADLRDRNAELETAIDDLRADIDARLETIESRIDSANSD